MYCAKPHLQGDAFDVSPYGIVPRGAKSSTGQLTDSCVPNIANF